MLIQDSEITKIQELDSGIVVITAEINLPKITNAFRRAAIERLLEGNK